MRLGRKEAHKARVAFMEDLKAVCEKHGIIRVGVGWFEAEGWAVMDLDFVLRIMDDPERWEAWKNKAED